MSTAARAAIRQAPEAPEELRARQRRLALVLALTALSFILFWWSASAFYYHSYTGMWADLVDWLRRILAALVNFDGGFFVWLGRLVVSVLDVAPLFTAIFFGGMGYRLLRWLRDEHPRPASANPLFDRHFRGIFSELVIFTALAAFIWWITGNTVENLHRLGKPPGFEFLNSTAGFGINQVLFVDYSETSTYGKALLVGVINTLVLSFTGIVLATIIGFIIGIMRLSHNWVISKLAAGYVEFFRNIPLLLQIFAWYNVVLKPLPGPRQSLAFGSIFINNRGVYAPKPIFTDAWWFVVAAFVFGIVASWIIARWAHRRQMETGQPFPVVTTALALILGLPLLTWFVVSLVAGPPVQFDYPALRGFNFQGGMRIIPEFVAMLLALSIYTGAFIGEIVRAGIQAVPHGQTEAALSLGLTRGQMLRLVIIPQALRVIIPPLTSQYLNLTKNSSLAVAIAYPDLVAVGGIVLNQSGHELEVIAIWMLVYLSISLATSAFMNWYNAKMKLVER